MRKLGSWYERDNKNIYIKMTTLKDLNRIKELKKEISFYGELSTSESKDKESYKRLVEDLKKELESLEDKEKKGKKTKK